MTRSETPVDALPRRDFLRSTMAAGLALGALRARSPGADSDSRKPARIRIGQIGTAHAHAAGKMETMRKSDEFEVVGIVEADPHRRATEESSRAYTDLKWTTEEELLNTP